MKHIGYLYIRCIDSIRYDIYQTTDFVFTDITTIGKKYKIYLPQKFLSLDDKIHLTLYHSENYEDFEKELKNPPSYIKINDEIIKNDNIINFVIH